MKRSYVYMRVERKSYKNEDNSYIIETTTNKKCHTKSVA